MKKMILAGLVVLGTAITGFAGQSGLINASGSISSSGDTTLVSAVSRKRITVTSFSLTTNSTNTFTAAFQSGTGGNQIWAVSLVSPSTATMTGANLAVPEKQGAIFKTAIGSLLNLNLSVAPTQPLIWAISYVEQDE